VNTSRRVRLTIYSDSTKYINQMTVPYTYGAQNMTDLSRKLSPKPN